MAIKASANITLVYVSDGTGYTVLLSNESYAFAAGTSSALAGSTSTNVTAYKNTSQAQATITKIGSTAVSGNATSIATGFAGLTAAVTGNGTTTCKITFSATTALTTKNGSISITISVDGKTFTKEFSFSLSLKGDTGGKGDKGDPTGIIESAIEPTTKYEGMLWKHTGNIQGLINGATYRWDGTKWDTYKFRAENIEADSFTGYEFNGSVFKSAFDSSTDTKRKKGNVTINNGIVLYEYQTYHRNSASDAFALEATGNVSIGIQDGIRFEHLPVGQANPTTALLTAESIDSIYSSIADLKSNLEYKTYTATNVNSNIGNKSIIIKANAYDCKINGFMYLNPATYNNDTILFKTPLRPSATIYFSTTVAGRGFKVLTDGSVRANGTYTVSAATYVYFGVSFAIA